ncbi:MAG: hypothetical protein JRH15_00230 [Deltaproteobacteria bacterium]|nr:hypothetical protein [Deltaproteobacteria bacterium]
MCVVYTDVIQAIIMIVTLIIGPIVGRIHLAGYEIQPIQKRIRKQRNNRIRFP